MKSVYGGYFDNQPVNDYTTFSNDLQNYDQNINQTYQMSGSQTIDGNWTTTYQAVSESGNVYYIKDVNVGNVKNIISSYDSSGNELWQNTTTWR